MLQSRKESCLKKKKSNHLFYNWQQKLPHPYVKCPKCIHFMNASTKSDVSWLKQNFKRRQCSQEKQCGYCPNSWELKWIRAWISHPGTDGRLMNDIAYTLSVLSKFGCLFGNTFMRLKYPWCDYKEKWSNDEILSWPPDFWCIKPNLQSTNSWFVI